jgi:hypothetical protein
MQEGTYQEVLKDSVGLWVREKLRETDIGCLENNISDVRVLGKECVGNRDRREIMQSSKGLQ